MQKRKLSLVCASYIVVHLPNAGDTALESHIKPPQLGCLQSTSVCLCMQMVFSSSCTVYGNPSKVPIDETHPLNACSPYGRTKLIIEDMFRDLAASPEGKEWRIILLRYFNPVGAHPSGMLMKFWFVACFVCLGGKHGCRCAAGA